MDKGKAHLEIHVALSILAYNLHIIGNELIKRKLKKQEEDQKLFITKLLKKRIKKSRDSYVHIKNNEQTRD